MDYLRPVEAIIPGVNGRVLAILAEATTEINLRTVARLAAVSPAQASRVLQRFVQLGIVERRDVPPAALFSLDRSNTAATFIVQLAHSRVSALGTVGRLAAGFANPPTSVIVFGSFARREADAFSDLDVVVVRPDNVDAEDAAWRSAIDGWRTQSRHVVGNEVDILEVDTTEARARLAAGQLIWSDIRRDGIVIHGRSIRDLCETVDA